MFAQVAHGGAGGVRSRVGLFGLQHQPLDPDFVFGPDVRQPQFRDRGLAGRYDHGQRFGLHHRRCDSVEWNGSNHHAGQLYSTDCASSRFRSRDRWNRSGIGADSRLGAIRHAKCEQHHDHRDIEHRPVYHRRGAWRASGAYFALGVHDFRGLHALLQRTGFHADGKWHESHQRRGRELEWRAAGDHLRERHAGHRCHSRFAACVSRNRENYGHQFERNIEFAALHALHPDYRAGRSRHRHAVAILRCRGKRRCHSCGYRNEPASVLDGAVDKYQQREINAGYHLCERHADHRDDTG